MSSVFSLLQEMVENYLLCPSCGSDHLAIEKFNTEAEKESGIVWCMGCKLWYRIENGLLEFLVPSLRDQAKLKSFESRYAYQIGENNFAAGEGGWGDEYKLGQKSYYDEDALPYETEMLQLSFWKAIDADFLERLKIESQGARTLLEVGCGSGRISIPAYPAFDRVIGFDISESMVRTAIRKRSQIAHSENKIFYFLGDAENIPLRNSKVDFAVFYGILHHLEKPEKSIKQMQRILKPGASFLGLENNRSIFRPVFDLFMRLKKIWNEKAHEEHFIMSRQEIDRWIRDAGFSASIWTSVFLPPHVLNWFPPPQARQLLRLTDAVCKAFPRLRDQGGLVLFSGSSGECVRGDMNGLDT